jgi:hypothetical protein
MPAGLDLLRSMRDVPEEPRTVVLSATDPANPYGSILPWPDSASTKNEAGSVSPKPKAEAGRPTRSVGARVILVDGQAAAYLRRGERELLLFLPASEPRRSQVGREVARLLLHLAASRDEGRRGMLIAEIDGGSATAHPAARLFIDEGFAATAMGLQARIAGIRVAADRRGGIRAMADPENDRDIMSETPQQQRIETSDDEHEAIRNSNDRDQELEREGIESQHNRGYDEAVRGQSSDTGSEDVDPDSAESDIDRDDTVSD